MFTGDVADDLLRRNAAQPRARVRRRHAHQRRCRQHRAVPQDPFLVQAGRARAGAADGGKSFAHAVGRQPAQRAARRARGRARRRQPLQRALDVSGGPSRRRTPCAASGRSTARRWKRPRPALPDRSSSAARSAASRCACSRSTRKATSSRRPTRRPTSRSASTNTASRSSTAWRSRPCGSAKLRS